MLVLLKHVACHNVKQVWAKWKRTGPFSPEMRDTTLMLLERRHQPSAFLRHSDRKRFSHDMVFECLLQCTNLATEKKSPSISADRACHLH